MARNLVVCCDGTGNSFGDRSTNVVRLCKTLVRDPDRQIVYYDPGVGTLGDPSAMTRLRRFLAKALDGAIGRTVGDNVGEAMRFLSVHYRTGDRLFLFGFSRGAYTVRALAGMLWMYGLLESGNENLWPYLWQMYCGTDEEARDARSRAGRTKARRFLIADEFKAALGRPVEVHFIGAWDTVSSVGWFWDPLALPFTRRNPGVRHVRHAVSIDERRAFFRQNLFADAGEGQDLKEVWFAGVHSDVGGGYPENEGGLATHSLLWMLHEAEASGLLVDPGRRAKALQAGSVAGVEVLHDSLDWAWSPLERLPRLRWRGPRKGRRWSMNLGHRRQIPDGARVHRSAEDRWSAPGSRYRPKNRPGPGHYVVEE